MAATTNPTATVLVFPADPGAWIDYGALPHRLVAVRVDRDGQYHAARLPAGDYLVVAIADESSADWHDPTVLQTLSRVSTKVTLADGDARSLTLKTTAASR